MNVNTRRSTESRRKSKSNLHGKENINPSRSQDDSSQNYAERAEKVLRDVKAATSRTMLNVKSTFGNLSQRIRRSARRSNSDLREYQKFQDNQKTPVKLYSPFGIVTPSPRKGESTSPFGSLITPRRFMFASPTGKIKQDIADLSSGIKELNTVAETLQSKKENDK